MKSNIRPAHILVGLLSLALLSCGRYDRAEAEAQIRLIEQSWAQVAVSGDPAVIEQIFADDFVGVAPDGARYNKQQFIADTRANPLEFTSNELNEMDVRFDGNVAIAQGAETFTRKDGARGRFVWTDVLVRRGEKWQIIAAQDAMVADTQPPAASGLFEDSKPSAAAREEINKTRNAYVSAWKASDAGKVAQLYTEDAQVLYPNQAAVRGRSAIANYFDGFFAEFPRNEFELTSEEIVTAGDWAFDRGNYRWKGTPRAGAPAEDNGKYLVILQRQAGGDWKIARDMDNSDRAQTQSTRDMRN